ncbi:MAG: hypothetical protein ABI199_03715 [Bacteroidia bacterium]
MKNKLLFGIFFLTLLFCGFVQSKKIDNGYYIPGRYKMTKTKSKDKNSDSVLVSGKIFTEKGESAFQEPIKFEGKTSWDNENLFSDGWNYADSTGFFSVKIKKGTFKIRCTSTWGKITTKKIKFNPKFAYYFIIYLGDSKVY